MLNNMPVMTSTTDNSYALTMNGIPLFASFETDIGEINGMVPGKGTYLMYSDIGSANGEMVLYLDNFNSGETVFQIDLKYIPNTSRLAADWNQTNPEDITYIKNKPFEFNEIYLRDFIEPADSSIKAFIGDNLNNYYGLVGNIKLPYHSDSSYPVELVSPCIYINNSSFYPSNITEQYYGDNILKFSIYSLNGQEVITNSTTIAVYVKNPCYEGVYINGEYVYVTFPEPGLYYLYHQDLNVKTKYASYLKYYWNTYNLQPDWSQDDSSHPGYIKNKPNITVTADINSYSSQPVSSSGVYYALGGRSSISTTSSVSNGSDSLVTSGGVYDALQNVKVTTDSSVSSSSTNPIQSKAIYTALGNRSSLPTIISTVSSGSSNIMTSGGVYTALGNRASLTFDNIPTINSTNLLTSGNIYNALQNLNVNASEADTVDGYHFRVSETPPVEGEVDDYTITFVI